jgi:hypothetical protein
MIEIIVMIGVVGNFLLQSYWFIWTLKNHSHKHIENNEENLPENKEIVTNSITNYTPTPKSKEEVFSGERKYDPNKVKGAFDSFFE